MDAVYDRNGDAIGWIDDNIVYDNNDRYRAVIVDGEIYQLGSNRLIGRLERGFLWDRNGLAVACLGSAEAPPSVPDFQPPPTGVELDKPGTADVPQAGRNTTPLPINDRWSQRTWVRYLDGQ
jgi:hypothetical protein